MGQFLRASSCGLRRRDRSRTAGGHHHWSLRLHAGGQWLLRHRHLEGYLRQLPAYCGGYDHRVSEAYDISGGQVFGYDSDRMDDLAQCRKCPQVPCRFDFHLHQHQRRCNVPIVTMATSSWTTAAIQDTDANFRIWGKELSDKLQAMSSTPGLVKTGDTGQIDWTTVTRAAVNSDAGYEVYYLNDSLHGTGPIYFKIYYGAGSNVAFFRIRVEVGTGSNGSGTITGTIASVRTITASNAGSATTYASYLCVNTGFVGLLWKTAANFQCGFTICRSCDSDGTPNIKAAHVVWSSSTTPCIHQTLRFESVAAAQTADSNGYVSVVPGYASSSAVGADYQVYLCWMNAPDVRPIFGLACVINADYPQGTTFSCALVGTTARTYLAAGTCLRSPANGSSSYGLAMLYE